MPWKSGTVMDQRVEFVRLAEQGDIGFAELCRRFSISRETGYVYLRRYRENGLDKLASRSSRPHHSPRRTAPAIKARIVALRDAHRGLGGRKVSRRLQDLGVAEVPAASTVTQVLRRHGRLDPAETPRRLAPRRFERATPNEL
jgi:transposase-like protein